MTGTSKPRGVGITPSAAFSFAAIFCYASVMQKCTAIILSHTSANEFNRIYTMYTKEAGLARVSGKGVRKANAKLAGHLEPGTLSEVYVARSRGMGQITSAITLDSFYGVKKDFGKVSEFLRIAKFFAGNFAEGEKDEAIFDLLFGFLFSFDKASEDKGKVLIEAFWWKLFDALGHRPEVMKCISCGERLRAGGPIDNKVQPFFPSNETPGISQGRTLEKCFSAEKGGVICEKCAAEKKGLAKISANQIKLLRIYLASPFKKILKVKAGGEELEKLGKIRKVFGKYIFQE